MSSCFMQNSMALETRCFCSKKDRAQSHERKARLANAKTFCLQGKQFSIELASLFQQNRQLSLMAQSANYITIAFAGCGCQFLFQSSWEGQTVMDQTKHAATKCTKLTPCPEILTHLLSLFVLAKVFSGPLQPNLTSTGTSKPQFCSNYKIWGEKVKA